MDGVDRELKMAIGYIETHLLDNISMEELASIVHISPYYLQKGFRIVTGYSIAEYIRYRRLYMAALDIRAGHDVIIDLAYKYGYDTPESFTKAFRRFHGCSPVQIKKNRMEIKTFLPLTIAIQVQGDNQMDVSVEKTGSFKVIGMERIFSFEDAYEKILEFWNEFGEHYLQPLFSKQKQEDDMEQAICDCMIGEYGIQFDAIREKSDNSNGGTFCYMIAGIYKGGLIPEGMVIREIPESKWAKFHCTGSMPGALQSINTKIFKEWLPGNSEYEFATGINIEWYSRGDSSAIDYQSEVWIPVKQIKE